MCPSLPIKKVLTEMPGVARGLKTNLKEKNFEI